MSITFLRTQHLQTLQVHMSHDLEYSGGWVGMGTLIAQRFSHILHAPVVVFIDFIILEYHTFRLYMYLV